MNKASRTIDFLFIFFLSSESNKAGAIDELPLQRTLAPQKSKRAKPNRASLRDYFSNFPISSAIVAKERISKGGGVLISISMSLALIRLMIGNIRIKIKRAIRNM